MFCDEGRSRNKVGRSIQTKPGLVNRADRQIRGARDVADADFAYKQCPGPALGPCFFPGNRETTLWKQGASAVPVLARLRILLDPVAQRGPVCLPMALNAACDPGGRRRRPRTSTAAAASVAPIARAPSSAPNRNIAKTKSPPAATSPSCGHQPLHQPGGPSRSRCAAPESRPPPPRDKERQLASRKCRRESTPQSAWRSASTDS